MYGLPFHKIVLRLVPMSFAVGAAMELFMIKTGFCEFACND